MCAVIPLLTATLFVLAARQGFVRAEDPCYYPDGSVADKDIPCGSSSSDTACCPYGWTCLDTGVCSLDSLNYITRYTCTDQSWDSPACPQYCLDGTPNGTDTGNVALLECSDNQYCCNGDRSGNCCKDKAVSLFEISPGSSPISVASAAAITATEVASSSEPASTVVQQTTTPSMTITSTRSIATSRSSSAPATTIVTSVVANPTNGAASTIYLTKTAAVSTQTPSNQGSESSSSSNKGVVVGCAVGIPVSTVLFAIIAFLLFRRRRRQRNGDCNKLLPSPEENEKGPRVSELDGFPRAAGGSIAPSGISEHYSGKRSRDHTRAASEVDGTPILATEKPPVELESPRNSKVSPVELDATETRPLESYFRIPPAIGETDESSPDPSRGYAVGVIAPGGLRIVNAAEGELDSEAEGDAEGRASAAGHNRGSSVRLDSPPPVHPSPITWRQSRSSLPGEISNDAPGAASGGIGSPVSPLQSHGWGR